MKLIFKLVLIGCLYFSTNVNSQNVAINNNGIPPDASAMLDVSSEVKGFLPPRMRTNMRTSIPSPATGLMVYDTDTESYWYRGVSSWIEISNSKTALWRNSFFGEEIQNRNGAFVQISNSPDLGIVEGVLGVRNEDPSETGIIDVLSIQRSTTGTGQNGIGGSIIFRNEGNSGGSFQTARISAFNEFIAPPIIRGAMLFKAYHTTPNIDSNVLYFNADGLTIGANTIPASMLDVKGDISLTGEIHNPEKTALANLLPICYGNVKSDGTINTGSNNFSVNRTGVGTYYITINSQTYHYLNYLATVTPTFLNVPRIAVTTSFDGDLIVRIFDIAGNLVDGYFNFVVHKP